jgi:hypothetical protein
MWLRNEGRLRSDGRFPNEWRRRIRSWRRAIVTFAPRLEPLLYVLVAGSAVLWVAALFYASLRQQTASAFLWANPDKFADIVAGRVRAPLSAPLDDVFIHFDFARSTARGFPFEWSEGNGYSSGGTSLLYPFVLALGYWLGFDEEPNPLMLWAGVVACVCVFALLLAARRAFAGLPRATTYLAPAFVLGVGALDWTLFSGMEVALFLAFWAGAWLAWDDLVIGAREGGRTERQALTLGFWGALVVATRPEGVVNVAVLALGAAFALRARGARAALGACALAAFPGALVVVGQAVANRLITGDFTAAGALTKLEIHHPYLSASEVFEAWKFHVGYQVLRVTNHHLSAVTGVGWVVWAFAALALLFRSTRRHAAALWASAASWVFVVALNGQVRWQNERYTMPAVAWFLLAAALGAGAALAWSAEPLRSALAARKVSRAVLVRAGAFSLTLAALGLFAWAERPRFVDQLWFFGRASRNIYDQHLTTGYLLRERVVPTPRRILLSDAGAIPFAADLPALDLIGLGGLRGLPFARASRLGAGAAVELLERMPPAERPDVFALYPSWWGALPLWFGRKLAEVPVRGNVICGGPSKVLYRPVWDGLDASAHPFRLESGERVVDELDVADVLSEQEHDYRLSAGARGYVTMKMLQHPDFPMRDVWDAGRTFDAGQSQRFVLRGLDATRPLRLIVRTAAIEPAALRVSVHPQGGGAPHFSGVLELEASDGWIERSLGIPAASLRESVGIEIVGSAGSWPLFHLWAVQGR